MRREFGCALDVQLFMRDHRYARRILTQALSSRDERLREYAAYVDRHLVEPTPAAQGPKRVSRDPGGRPRR